jgi:hypothetical protein
MYRAVAEKLLATIAVIGVAVTNGALVARLCGYLSFDAAMLTATVAGIGATLAGGAYLLARLSDIERRKLST